MELLCNLHVTTVVDYYLCCSVIGSIFGTRWNHFVTILSPFCHHNRSPVVNVVNGHLYYDFPPAYDPACRFAYCFECV